MIIVENRALNLRIVTVGKSGWLIYTPPLEKDENPFFVPVDDPAVISLAEQVGVMPEALLKSKELTGVLLEKFCNTRKLSRTAERVPARQLQLI